MKSGAELIAEERLRHQSEEGYSTAHDQHFHKDGQMATAAACYALPARRRDAWFGYVQDFPGPWPWASRFWKPTPDDRVRELVKAGALIAAEIDRLQEKPSNEARLLELMTSLKYSRQPRMAVLRVIARALDAAGLKFPS